jgi:oligoendopeptidase F
VGRHHRRLPALGLHGPDHSRVDRKNAWLDLRRRLGGVENWSGYEDAQAYAWHRQLHLFTVPFYYIEYGIAQTGALQVWRNAKKSRKGAIAKYRAGESLGWTRPLPGLFRAAGLNSISAKRRSAPW